MIYLGVDPGASGGIGVISCYDGKARVTAFPMPDTAEELWELLREYGTPAIRHPNNGHRVYSILEKVGGMIGPEVGEKKSNISKGVGPRMFKFGVSYGMCYMALTAAGIPFDIVHPKTWQKDYNLARVRGESKSQWKGRLKEEAQRLFPRLKITLSTSDALLLAEHARRKYRIGVRS